MKIHDVDQGSPEWIALRLGRPTASEFSNIITPKTGILSASARPYAIRLCCERLLNRPMMALDNLEWVERGKALEPMARRAYEFDRDVVTTQVGFVTSDDGRYGASPDSLVSDDGLLEIKCPSPQHHLAALLEDGLGDDHRPQVQGQMYVAERDWCDLMSFSDEMPHVIRRVPRDDRYIAKLAQALDDFCGMLDEYLEKARRAGMFAERAAAGTPVDNMVHELDGHPF